MQPIGDYLKKLLYQYDCLVVPGLGAFLIHAVSASYNEEEGLFFPPRRRLAFNEAMRLDDGILMNYIMLHEACGREQAIAHMAGFVRQIKESAQREGSYVIEGIGLFSFNAENSLQFDPELRHNFLGNVYGCQPVRYASSISFVRGDDGLQQIKQPTLQPAVAEAAGHVVALSIPAGVGWRWAAAALLAGTLGYISYFTVIHPDQGLQGSLNPATMFRVFTPSAMHLPAWLSDKPKTPVAKPMATQSVDGPVADEPTAVPAPVSAVMPVPAPTVESPVTKPAPLVVSETPVAVKMSSAKPIKSAVTAPVVKPFAESPLMVVAGSFASRQNAIRLRKRLRAAGYTDATIITPTKRGELIKVAALGAATLDEARERKDSLSLFTGVPALIVRNR